GKFLARRLLEQGVDMPYAYAPLHHQGLAHAFLNTVFYLDYDRVGFPYPIVAFQVNCYGRRVIAQKGFRASMAKPLAHPDRHAPRGGGPGPAVALAEALRGGGRGPRGRPPRQPLAGGADRVVELVARLPHRQAPSALSRYRGRSPALRGAPPRRLRGVARAHA